MVPADGGDDGDSGCDGVRGVQAATETGFEHDPRVLPLREPFKRESEGEFEEGGMRVPSRDTLTKPHNAGGDLGRRDHAFGVANALAEVNQVRRGEDACAEACGFENGMNEDAGGAFAVRAGHVDELLTGGWQVHLSQEPPDVVKAQFDAIELGAVEPVDFALRRVVDHSRAACWRCRQEDATLAFHDGCGPL